MEIHEIIAKTEEEIKICKDEILSVTDQASLNQFKGAHLGKKSLCATLFAEMKNISADKKQEAGKLIISLREQISFLFSQKENELKETALKEKLIKDRVDISFLFMQ